MAQELWLDIVPVCLNGVGYVLPKRELMLRKGHISVTVGERVAADDLSRGADARSRTQAFHKYYLRWYQELESKNKC